MTAGKGAKTVASPLRTKQLKVCTPLLESTQRRTREHARRIIERELTRDFDGFAQLSLPPR
jgi:hypothetical protein